MTVQELYESLEGDYEGVIERMGSDEIILRFLGKFVKDQSFAKLKDAVEKKEVEESFAHAHTLKGVVGNFGFTKLYQAVCNLVEQLRPRTEEADMELFLQVEREYKKVLEQIAQVI